MKDNNKTTKEPITVTINGEKYMSETNAAAYIDMDRWTLLKRRTAGHPIAQEYRDSGMGNRRVLYKKTDLDKWIKNRIQKV
jgi:PHD/YefM family antitoxin component YafN of YafNO toxin-antitoxin module